ncbi:MAG: hypothetical protein B6I38_02505 [Anaerolineaceae bacterium 4572_5.1]|nr:MAG: hypothetical protein B6I38_02505 [Anaerolineaceae bacterium 4572_5.1]
MNIFQNKLKPQHQSMINATIVFLAAAFVFSQYGFNGTLRRDDAVFLYSGQQLLKGIPPYISIFQPKTPLWAFFAGLGAAIAQLFNFSDILAVRGVFFVVSCLTVVAIYFLGGALFQSRKVGFLAAFIFIGFWGFGRHAASGPRAKSVMVLFECLALLFTTRKKWFWAGISGSLAFLTWQPTLIYPILTIFLAFTQSEHQERKRHLAHAIAGIFIPLALIVAYLLYTSAFKYFIDDAFLFPILDLEHLALSLSERLLLPVDVIFLRSAYSSHALAIFLGLSMLIALFVWRIKVHGGLLAFLSSDTFAAFLLSFLAPVIWSVLDFQGYPDFFVFLPYFAISFAWMVFLTLEGLRQTKGVGNRVPVAAFCIICALLLFSAAREYRLTAEDGLLDQLQWAQEIETNYLTEDNDRLLSLGRPEILVLLHRTNANRHIVINSGEHKIIEALTLGGLDGWLSEQIGDDSPVVVLGEVSPRDTKAEIRKWLESHGFEKKAVGSWVIYTQIP